MLTRSRPDIRARGAQALPILADVSVADNFDRAAAQVHDAWGDVRLLVNNAAIETMGASWEIPAARWDLTLNLYINGVVHGVRAFAPRMIAACKPAFIANVTSVAAFGVMPVQTAYITTKHAVQSFSECLYLEMQLAGAPVRVSSVIPGMVRTDIFADATAAAGETAHVRAHRAAMRAMMAAYGEWCSVDCGRVNGGFRNSFPPPDPVKSARTTKLRIGLFPNSKLPIRGQIYPAPADRHAIARVVTCGFPIELTVWCLRRA